MRSRKQSIESGDQSANYQALGDMSVTNNMGLSYKDVKEISIEIFKDNFYELSNEAAQIAYARVEELIDNLLKYLQNLNLPEQELSEKIKNPDIQYALTTAQIQYARSGESSTMEMLTRLLSERFTCDERSLKRIVINEAIEVTSKITLDQINNLTLLFLVKSCKLTNVRLLFDYIYLLKEKFGNYTDKTVDFYEHLQYAGLLTNDISIWNHQPLEYLMSKWYADDLDVNIKDLNQKEKNQKIRSMFDEDKAIAVFDCWNKSKIQDYSLTSVGKVIAISNFNNIIDANLNLDIWIKD